MSQWKLDCCSVLQMFHHPRAFILKQAKGEKQQHGEKDQEFLWQIRSSDLIGINDTLTLLQDSRSGSLHQIWNF